MAGWCVTLSESMLLYVGWFRLYGSSLRVSFVIHRLECQTCFGDFHGIRQRSLLQLNVGCFQSVLSRYHNISI